ncbi:HD-GYP domain-containing protein [Fundidesulfovibrio terrae]|uniref:HD-GYP domain-containing protein n=1 Tax=Fundidesulfovibrio terrae TaxID=2922866 RepID=UPI001FAFD5D7|nr:HD-GYP domain-containing protein [Fundidesulfovibrio terrae]
MIVKISVSNLKPGMYVTNPGLSQEGNPNIYLAERLLAGVDDIREIAEANHADAFVDTEKGTFFTGNPRYKKELENPFAAVTTDSPSEVDGTVNFDAVVLALEEAERQYKGFLNYSREFMSGLKVAKEIDMKECEGFIDDVIKQAEEVGGALQFLSKLKQFDDYSYTHNLNVSMLSVLFGRHLGFGRDNLMILGLSGLFHDIGKLLIPARILKKPGKLTQAEAMVMMKHPVYSRDILLKQRDIPADVVRAAYEHHEYHAGGGYPEGIAGDRIGKASSLISIVDTYDAVTSDRCYRPAVHSYKAVSLIFSLKGKSFSPALTDHFIRFVGVYPVGAIVVLDNGRKAIVIEQNQENLLFPKVRVILDEKNRYCTPRDIDLLKERGGRRAAHVVDCLSNQECRIHVDAYLKGAA